MVTFAIMLKIFQNLGDFADWADFWGSQIVDIMLKAINGIFD